MREGHGAQDRPAEGHEQRRRHALVGHVGDDDAPLVVVQGQEVVEVAAHLARRLPVGGHRAAGDAGAAVGQEAGLNGVGDVQFLLHAGAVGRLAVELVVDDGRGCLLGDAVKDVDAPVGEGRPAAAVALQADDHGPHQPAAGHQREVVGRARAQHRLQPAGHAHGVVAGPGQPRLAGVQRQLRRHLQELVAVDLQRLHQTAAHGADAVARPSLEQLPILVPDQDEDGIDAHQQRHQPDDGVQNLVQVGQAVDGLSHLEQGGVDPGFFLLGGAQVGALQPAGRLASHVTHQFFAAGAEGVELGRGAGAVGRGRRFGAVAAAVEIDDHGPQGARRPAEQRVEAQAGAGRRGVGFQPGRDLGRSQRLAADVNGVESRPIADGQPQIGEALVFVAPGVHQRGPAVSLVVLVPQQEGAQIDPGQQRGQPGHRGQHLFRLVVAADGLGHLQLGGGDPGLLLFAGHLLCLVDGAGDLGRQGFQHDLLRGPEGPHLRALYVEYAQQFVVDQQRDGDLGRRGRVQLGRHAVQVGQVAVVFVGVVDGYRLARGRGRADDAPPDRQAHHRRAVVVAIAVQLGDGAGLDDDLARQRVEAEDGDGVEAKGALRQVDGLCQHLVQFIGGVHLAGDLRYQLQVGGAGALLGEEPGVGDGRGGLIGQNGQPAQVLLAEVARPVALGGYEAQGAATADEGQEEGRARRGVAVIGGAGRQLIHLALEVAHQQRLL